MLTTLNLRLELIVSMRNYQISAKIILDQEQANYLIIAQIVHILYYKILATQKATPCRRRHSC